MPLLKNISLTIYAAPL